MMKLTARYLAFILLGGISIQAYGSLLSFNPTSLSTSLGDTIDVDIVISDLNGSNVAAFEFNVIFDDSVLAFQSYSLSDNLGDLSLGDAYDFSNGYLGMGTINISELSMVPDLSFQQDSLTLATLTFRTDAIGISGLDFRHVNLSTGLGGNLVTIPAARSVDVSGSVPEPPAILLMVAGLILPFFARNMKKVRMSGQCEKLNA
jgi:hypothetical protein